VFIYPTSAAKHNKQMCMNVMMGNITSFICLCFCCFRCACR